METQIYKIRIKIYFIIFFFTSINSFAQSKNFFKKPDNKITSENNNVFFKKKIYPSNSLKDSIIIKIDTSKIKTDSLFKLNTKIEFLNSPLEDGVLTSHFSKNRFHPIQKKWKAHNGTDFAAAYGTPIKATAGGIVEKTGYTNANGFFVKIKHNSTYSTQYLHMSKILVNVNDSIKKGEEIGLVGESGYATGPHVCYRFWKNGIQVDPFELNFSNEIVVDGNDYKKNQVPEKKKTTAEKQNEEEFKTFVSGFFKKKTD